MEEVQILILHFMRMFYNEKLKLVITSTTRARQTEVQRLHLLANQCQETEAFSPAYQEETFLRLVELAESQSNQWAWGWTTSFKSDTLICVQDLHTTSAVSCWYGWENVRHPSGMCQLLNCCTDARHPNLVVADARCMLSRWQLLKNC